MSNGYDFITLLLYNAEGVLCIHIGVGLCVARFDGMGNARASECGTSNKSDSHAFSYIMPYYYNNADLGSPRCLIPNHYGRTNER